MLMAINGGHVPNCGYRQEDIVHLVSEAQAVQKSGRPFVFSDIHAVLNYAQIFANLDDLDQIDWSIFFESPQRDGYCAYWHNRHTPPQHMRRKEIRQAEFLVHQFLELAVICEISVISEQIKNRVRAALDGTRWNPPITVRRGWYY
jgi:ssDNA thymidine ADP-ribosyltransferase, DarT